MADELQNRRVEEIRQGFYDDAKYVKSLPYVFELKVPAAALQAAAPPNTSFFYTLPYNPQGLTIEDPFTVATVPGINGGLVVEENGIVNRALKLSGVLGFRPSRKNQNTPNLAEAVVRSFAPRGDYFEAGSENLSGQRHLQFLQDRVFRAYADLKRDPKFSRGVQMFFHNLKDSEGWEVVPTSFVVNRQAPKSTLYYYEISLIIVGPAKLLNQEVQEARATTKEVTFDKKITPAYQLVKRKVDLGFFEAIRKAIREAFAWVNDVLKFIDNVERFVANVRNTIGEALDAINSVVNALDRLLKIPGNILRTATRLVDDVRNVAASIVRTAGTVAALPDTLAAAWHRLGDSIEKFAGLGAFYNQEREAAARDRLNVESAQSARNATISTAQTVSTLSDLARAGTTPTIGDIVSALERAGGAPVPRINSLTYHSIGSSDNLSTLATRYLGDAGFWWVIAELNGLKPPYISNIPIPGTVRPGQTLLIPSTLAVSTTGTIGGITTDEQADAAARTLFKDLQLSPSSRYASRYDLKIDAEKGRRDVRYVEGVANLQQGLRTRLETTLGENPIFPNLGIPRIVGVSNAEVDTEIVRIMVRRTLETDGRVATVNSVQVSNEASVDAYVIDADIAVRGVGAIVPVPSVRTTVR